MSGVKYSGTFLDYSGYGQANRSFITALYHAGVDLTTELVVQVPERGFFGWTGELCKDLQGLEIDYKIKIIHLTPDMYPRYMESGKYHIGHLFWETDQLPKEWVGPCNKMNEIWTASDKQAEMIKKSGVTVPIKWFPQPIDILPSKEKEIPYIIPGFSGFVFYSIFQWIERKNPRALIVNFWKAFKDVEDACLLIKTYRTNYTDGEFDRIKETIEQWKRENPQDKYPKVFMVRKLMNTKQMFRLHSTGNCYVSTSRGEGWCIPAVEAALMGKPIISIDQTGFVDYLTKEQFYPCDSTADQIVEVPNIQYYKAYQNWLEINPEALVNQMKEVYNNQKEATVVGKKARQYVLDNFNYWVVGRAMKDRIEEISKEL